MSTIEVKEAHFGWLPKFLKTSCFRQEKIIQIWNDVSEFFIYILNKKSSALKYSTEALWLTTILKKKSARVFRQLQTNTSTCPRALVPPDLLSSPVFTQLPTPARRKQETGVEAGVRLVINASVSREDGARGERKEER